MEDKRLAAIGPNPSGLCMCGCERKTKIVTKSDRRHGHVMGQPFRFIHGHCRPTEKGPNRFKLRRRTAVIFLERRDGTVLECLVSSQLSTGTHTLHFQFDEGQRSGRQNSV